MKVRISRGRVVVVLDRDMLSASDPIWVTKMKFSQAGINTWKVGLVDYGQQPPQVFIPGCYTQGAGKASSPIWPPLCALGVVLKQGFGLAEKCNVWIHWIEPLSEIALAAGFEEVSEFETNFFPNLVEVLPVVDISQVLEPIPQCARASQFINAGGILGVSSHFALNPYSWVRDKA